MCILKKKHAHRQKKDSLLLISLHKKKRIVKHVTQVILKRQFLLLYNVISHCVI